MNLKQKIAEDFKEAFKAKNLEKKEVLSAVQSEIKNKEIELGRREDGLSDEDVVSVLQRAIKQRKDSASQFQDGGRQELAEKEELEAKILQEYLPAQMSDEEVEEKVSEIIEKVSADGECDLGKVMGLAMSELKGQTDGSKVRDVAQKLLQK